MAEALGAPVRLRCEFKKDPLGIVGHPTFSWWVSDTRAAELQSAYEIQAASESWRLSEDAPDLWQSGRIEGWENAHVPYQGLSLRSGQSVYWRVRTYDSDGQASPWSAQATFAMGWLEAQGFNGSWISAGMAGSRYNATSSATLHRQFEMTEACTEAQIYIGVKGQALLLVNGQSVAVLDQQWLDYSREYACYMVAVGDYLQLGTNRIEVVLADGVYAGSVAGVGRELYGRKPSCKLLLHAEYENGQILEISSDQRWRWSPNNLVSHGWQGGEDHDLREPADSSGYELPFVEIIADDGSAARYAEMRAPNFETAEIEVTPTRFLGGGVGGQRRLVNRYVLAELITGRVAIEVRSKEADDIEVRYLADGVTINRDRFTTQGEGRVDTLRPKLAIRNFSAIEVEYSVDLSLIESVQTESVPKNNSLKVLSDHKTLDGFVTHCLNQSHAFGQSAPLKSVYSDAVPDFAMAGTWAELMSLDGDSVPVLKRWLTDAEAGFVAPGDHGAYGNGRIPVGDDDDEFARMEAYGKLAWSIYRHQNDVALLRHAYPHLRAGALSYKHKFADLLRQGRADLFGSGTNGTLVATASWFGHLGLLKKIALASGHFNDTETIDQLALGVQEAFRRRFITVDGHIVSDELAAVVATLHWRLVPAEQEADLVELMISEVRRQAFAPVLEPTLSVALLTELTRADRLDVAYMVLLQTTKHSWMGRVLKGYTLTYAGTELDAAQMGVLNWLIGTMVGLQLPDDAEYSHEFVIAPKPPFGAQFQAGAPVNEINALITTMFGELAIDWQIDQETFNLQIVLPPGTSAVVSLPDGVVAKVQSGKHKFSVRFDSAGDGLPILRDVAG